VENERSAACETRSSLLSRLRNHDDHASWQDFFDTYWRLIYRAARQAGLNDAEAQDVVQDTVVYVARRIATFRYDRGKGCFKGWLLQTTRWRIADQFRRRSQSAAGVSLEEDADRAYGAPVEALPDPAGNDLERIWEEEWTQAVTAEALRRIRARASPRQFQIFDLYVVKGWSVAEVCRVLGVTAAQVYLAKHRLAASVRGELQRLEETGL